MSRTAQLAALFLAAATFLFLALGPALSGGYPMLLAKHGALALSLSGFLVLLICLAREGGGANEGSGIAVAAAVVGIALAKLFLVRNVRLSAYAFAGHDDRLFINLADYLRHGDWLGPYNDLTLAKGPAYPIWIALCAKIGTPLLLGEHLLYIIACAVTMAALRPIVRRRYLLLPAFALLVFNPVTYTFQTLRVMREGVVPAETLLVLGCLIGVHTHRASRVSVLAVWSAALGLAVAAFWLTREDGVWLVPSVAVLLAYTTVTLIVECRADRFIKLAVGVLGPLAIWGALCLGVCALNYGHYGVFLVGEFRSGAFPAAYGALLRVKPTPWQRYVPVPRETRQRIYALSPSFKELEPYLEGDCGRFWGTWSNKCFGVPVSEIGAHFMWALRDAVVLAGRAHDGREAAAFYRQIAAEVNSACDRRVVRATGPRASFVPPFRKEYARALPPAVVQGLKKVIWFDDLSPCPQPSAGTPEGLEFMRALTRDRFTPVMGTGEWPAWQSDGGHAGILGRVVRFYRAAIPWLVLLAVVAFVVRVVLAVRRRQFSYPLALACALLLAVTARVTLLALVSVTTITTAVDVLYLSPAYPPLLLLIGVCLTSLRGGVAVAALAAGAPARLQRPDDPHQASPI